MARSIRGFATVALVIAAVSNGVADYRPMEANIRPEWKDLPGADGRTHSFSDLSSHPVVVVAFVAESCPYSKAYEDRFRQFATSYADRGVAFVAINVSLEPEDELESLVKIRNARPFPYLYLRDKSQESGQRFGAKVTPHLFVLDKQRRLVYSGAFDDSKTPAKVTSRHVVKVVDQLLQSDQIEPTSTRAVGCAIRYNDRP